VTYVAEGDILFLDSSTTVAAFADALTKTSFTNLTIVTNSVAAMRFFPKFPPHYVLISLGGSYDPQLNAFLGAATLRELERLTLTKAFVSCFGVNEKIATTNHEAQAGLITRVLDRTDRRYLLADRSKFGRTGLHKLAARGFFDAVVSER
jgi:DeoR/GlpR family transcriptional regulator of sugar metabolism